MEALLEGRKGVYAVKKTTVGVGAGAGDDLADPPPWATSRQWVGRKFQDQGAETVACTWRTL